MPSRIQGAILETLFEAIIGHGCSKDPYMHGVSTNTIQVMEMKIQPTQVLQDTGRKVESLPIPGSHHGHGMAI